MVVSVNGDLAKKPSELVLREYMMEPIFKTTTMLREDDNIKFILFSMTLTR